ncbi:MAG: hypothetical protein NC483_04845, partial [Ruminococcus sp.]|nr:hypothetical protein [Ruminococcus sp.]
WVEFGGYYWRIVRVNGDGSIRMIYQGTEPNEKGEKTQIETSKFNEKDNDNSYVGYFYEEGQVHGLKEPSNAYTYLNAWFASSNIKEGSVYFDKINLNAGFCGDRTPSLISTPTITLPYNIGDGLGGIGKSTTYYGAYLRLAPGGGVLSSNDMALTPTLSCSNNDDLYTYKNSISGNKKLANPVGLITADEVILSGMIFAGGSSKSYLNTNQHYWTISPSNFSETLMREFCVNLNGNLGYRDITYSLGIRPVINIRSDVTLTGDGTISNPYKVN